MTAALSRLVLFGLALSLLVPMGCATSAHNQPWRPDELYDVGTIEQTASVDTNGGFVYGGSSLFSPRRARRVGDMVTVMVIQNTAADSTAGTRLQKKNEQTAGIRALFGLEGLVGQLPNLPGGGPSLDLDAQAEQAFDGNGGTNRAGSLTGTLTARVLKVLPNGHLVIAGRQAVKINNEVEVLGLRGVVDPRSILANNTVLSTSVADARIEYGGTGVVAGKQRPGWMSRILDTVSPF
ncbi:MAG: flagellar biosynthesis protein FlgH [Rickettsiales bacterium]|nr:flagellar biosynthesis protein FlgH [Rickettsiales bacterium]|tara:strand:+ start:265 stop:975 length:711 start_codon:yes stop_codon:yes gene_type:complete